MDKTLFALQEFLEYCDTNEDQIQEGRVMPKNLKEEGEEFR